MDKILTKNDSILIADGDVLTIEQSSGGGSSANLQSSKSYIVAASGSQTISSDSGYDAIEEVALSVPAGTAGTPTATNYPNPNTYTYMEKST